METLLAIMKIVFVVLGALALGVLIGASLGRDVEDR